MTYHYLPVIWYNLILSVFSFQGRAWLRSTLNEHSLERYFHHMVGNKTLLRQATCTSS